MRGELAHRQRDVSVAGALHDFAERRDLRVVGEVFHGVGGERDRGFLFAGGEARLHGAHGVVSRLAPRGPRRHGERRGGGAQLGERQLSIESRRIFRGVGVIGARVAVFLGRGPRFRRSRPPIGRARFLDRRFRYPRQQIEMALGAGQIVEEAQRDPAGVKLGVDLGVDAAAECCAQIA